MIGRKVFSDWRRGFLGMESVHIWAVALFGKEIMVWRTPFIEVIGIFRNLGRNATLIYEVEYEDVPSDCLTHCFYLYHFILFVLPVWGS
jgi:hypothetical protein